MGFYQYNDGQAQLVNSNIKTYNQKGTWDGYRYQMTYNVIQSDTDSEQIICVKAAPIQRSIKVKDVKTRTLVFYTSDDLYQTQTGYLSNNPLIQVSASSTTSGDYKIYTINLSANKYLYITYKSGSQSGGTSTYPWYINSYSRAEPTEVYAENPQPFWVDTDLRIYSTGMNEFDPNNLDTATANIYRTSIVYDSTAESVRIPCKGNVTYTVGFSSPVEKSSLWMVFYTDSENYPTPDSSVSGVLVIGDNVYNETSKITTFTTPNTAKYIWLEVSQDIYPYMYVEKESGWYLEDVHLFDNNIWS